MQDDRSTVARIRDEAMRLFAQRGEADVSLREIAGAADVSAPLIIHHFGSKAALREAIDTHVAAIVSEMLETLTEPDQVDGAGIAELLGPALQTRPFLIDYLRRMLVDGGTSATALFGTLHDATLKSLLVLADAGAARVGPDPEVLAAFLLANDLATVVLREPIRAATGVDPLERTGLERWSSVLMDVYSRGIFLSTDELETTKET